MVVIVSVKSLVVVSEVTVASVGCFVITIGSVVESCFFVVILGLYGAPVLVDFCVGVVNSSVVVGCSVVVDAVVDGGIVVGARNTNVKKLRSINYYQRFPFFSQLKCNSKKPTTICYIYFFQRCIHPIACNTVLVNFILRPVNKLCQAAVAVRGIEMDIPTKRKISFLLSQIRHYIRLLGMFGVVKKKLIK